MRQQVDLAASVFPPRELIWEVVSELTEAPADFHSVKCRPGWYGWRNPRNLFAWACNTHGWRFTQIGWMDQRTASEGFHLVEDDKSPEAKQMKAKIRREVLLRWQAMLAGTPYAKDFGKRGPYEPVAPNRKGK